MPDYRSRTSTHGRNMAGARSCWRATGMKDGDFGKPIIAVVNSFTQFVPGHVTSRISGNWSRPKSRRRAGVAMEFNTIAVDDGIAMGHDGMLYSLPSRDLIADSGRIHGQRPLRRRHGLHLQLRQDHPGHVDGGHALNIPTIFVSGGPMEAGKIKGVERADRPPRPRRRHGQGRRRTRCPTPKSPKSRRSACPTCGSCSGCSPPTR